MQHDKDILQKHPRFFNFCLLLLALGATYIFGSGAVRDTLHFLQNPKIDIEPSIKGINEVLVIAIPFLLTYLSIRIAVLAYQRLTAVSRTSQAPPPYDPNQNNRP